MLTVGRRWLPWLALVIGIHQATCEPQKKLIETGWDQPDTRQFRANLAQMEQRPFDGVVLTANGSHGAALSTSFRAGHWEREWFQGCVDDLRACRSARLTDNFVLVGANPGNVEWFDDAGWAAVVDHWRLAAWLARQGGLKGILFDPEPYTPPAAQFADGKQSARATHSFADYCLQARRRGREVMAAVAEQYPDITVFCYFMNVENTLAAVSPDPPATLEGSTYGLYPAFIDGWLDAAPPTVTFVDGCENAYLYHTDAQFLQAAVVIKGACQRLVSPENRARYRAQVQVGFGLYLDAYHNEKPPWFIAAAPGGTRVDKLRDNAACALRVADGYVWIYGEQYRWWPTPNGSVKAQDWNAALPGCEDALRYARDPLDFGRTKVAALRAAGKLVNLARNGDFGSDHAAPVPGAQADWQAGGAPAGWSTWQTTDSKGQFTWDRTVGDTAPGAARAAGVADGCFIQTCPAKPGERYLVRAVAKRQGRGRAWLRVRWQTADGAWTMEDRDALVPCAAAADDWGEMATVVTVPDGVGRLVLLLGVSGQRGEQDVAWFDDVWIHDLDA
jgi:hypothetical protein